MRRVVCDTNVYISAILTPGKSREILELAGKGEIELVVSQPILLEIERILRLKLQRTNFEVVFILEAIRGITILVSPASRLSVIKEDETDNRVLECAVVREVDYIVSGDKQHILPLKEFRGIKIVSPAEFLNRSDLRPRMR